MTRCFLLASCFSFFFFFNDTATTEIYTLSLHDALPISPRHAPGAGREAGRGSSVPPRDRKSTRLNSSHDQISYAVFCLKKKKKYSRTSYGGGARYVAGTPYCSWRRE